MKTIQKHTLTAWAAAALIIVAMEPVHAQGSAGFELGSEQEAPKTAAEKLQSLQSRHDLAFSELSTTLNRLPKEPGFLGTKELFAEIDKSTREMKSVRAGCTSLMASLRADFKTIAGSSSFTDDQKMELKESAEGMDAECGVLAKKLDLAIERLGAAYTILPRWNRIHKSYRNLQGHEKAAQQVQVQVDEYLASFVPKPQPAADDEPQAEGEEG